MKWLPTLLILVVFVVLLWVSSMRPEAVPAAPAAQDPALVESVPQAAVETRAEGAEPERKQQPAPAPGALTGRIIGPGERPVPSHVLVLDASGAEVRRQPTDGLGRFSVEGLAPGKYQVTAQDPNWMYTVASTVEVEIARDATRPAVVNVDRGTSTVMGEVRDGLGEEITGATVRIEARAHGFAVRTDAQGRYRLAGLPSGAYGVGVAGFPASFRSITLGEDAAVTQDFTVVAPARLELVLAGAPRSVVPAASVRLTMLESEAPQLFHAPVPRETGEDGKPFTVPGTVVAFADLPPARYEVDVLDAAGTSILKTPLPPTYRLLEGTAHRWALQVEETLPGTGTQTADTILLWIVILGSVVTLGLLAAAVALPEKLFLTPRPPPGLPLPPPTRKDADEGERESGVPEPTASAT